MNVFVDTATVTVRSGKGGDGCSHLRQEKNRPKGGPDGGNGGHGGDVTVTCDPHLDTLVEFSFRAHFFAEDGQRGLQKSCHGADGASVDIRLPVGTIVSDAETGEQLADLLEPGQRAVVARGGRGGLGNEHFKGPLRQTPTECTPGEPAIERRLLFELKLIADIGLVGLPNAGKSTLLRAVSRANAKVGAYPFTTLSPQLGIAEIDADRRLVFADLPGLIEGAAQGAGLGHDFLRHVERTRAIVHLVDLAPLDGSDPAANWRTIRGELLEFSAELADKPELVVLSKVDLVDPADRDARIERFAGAIGMPRGERPLAVSGATGEGVRAMLEAAWRLSGKAAEAPVQAPRWSGPAGARP